MHGNNQVHSDPAAMRQSYLAGSLSETDVAADWLTEFRAWFGEAVPVELEPNAMQLATVDAQGRPSVRTVLCKGFDETGLVFYTNYDSAKGQDLEVSPYAAVVFVWLTGQRQVRLSGPVCKVSAAETLAYFQSRPRGSQVGAWASPQSSVVASRQELEERAEAAAQRFDGQAVLDPPPTWGGYRLSPELVEFWQGRADRLHDRLRYRRTDEGWTIERLAP